MENKLITLLKSRKFWAALIGLVLLIIKSFDDKFPLNDEEVTNMVYLLVAYIIGTGLDMNKWIPK
jgi:hypothetical protein